MFCLFRYCAVNPSYLLITEALGKKRILLKELDKRTYLLLIKLGEDLKIKLFMLDILFCFIEI